MRLERPRIPIAVRVQVAERQMEKATGCVCTDALGIPLAVSRPKVSDRKRLDAALFHLSRFGTVKLELHHDPALCNRRSYKRMVRGKLKTFYDPPANDPEHLVYLAEDDHDIRTRVRGIGAQRSDLGQLRYNKRVARNRASKSAAKVRRPKRKWPSRPMRSS